MKRPRRPLKLEIHRVHSWSERGMGLSWPLPDTPGREATLFNAFPGEELEVLRGKGPNAWPFRLLSARFDRREAPCPHFGSCGGCTLQSLNDQAQLELKSAPLLERLAKLCPDALLEPAQASPTPYHYRSKLEFSFVGEELGFHWRGRFDRVVNVEHCYLAPPPQPELLAVTRQWQREFSLSGWNPRTQQGDLRYLVMRSALPRSQGTHWLAVLVTSPQVAPAAVREWARRVSALPGNSAGIWARQSSTACAVKPDQEELLWGDAYLDQRLGELKFRLGWRSFFQSNPPGYLRLLERARDWLQLEEGASILDLFCGIGSIGLFLQKGPLIGVEAVEEAILDARATAAANGRQAEFHCCPSQDWPDLACDLLILDPPRSGCHPRLIERVVNEGPGRLLYISCNPHLWLQEMEKLSSRYRLVRAQPFDFFPQTRHIELLALLERR